MCLAGLVAPPALGTGCLRRPANALLPVRGQGGRSGKRHSGKEKRPRNTVAASVSGSAAFLVLFPASARTPVVASEFLRVGLLQLHHYHCFSYFDFLKAGGLRSGDRDHTDARH